MTGRGDADSMGMPPGQSRSLADAEPRTGAVVLFDGREWRVTEQASYSTADGYRVHEWCCEGGGTTGYLLKEGDPKQGTVRWFFTREIPRESVKDAAGERLVDRLKRTPDPPPPDALEYEGGAYHYAETTDGTHEDESGQRVRKVTWDYWDGAHARNLAIEQRPDGTCDAYLGAYVEPGQFGLRPAAATQATGFFARGNPLLAMAVALLPSFLIGFIMGWPFDEAVSLALCLAVALAWVMLVPRVPLAAIGAVVLGAIAAAAFRGFPPFTTWTGLLSVLGVPALIGQLGRSRGYLDDRRAVQYAGAWAVAAPLLGVGLYAYFSLAPGPHTPEQLWLALGPAGLGAVAGFLVAGIPLRRGAS